jgi:hypothetical protein
MWPLWNYSIDLNSSAGAAAAGAAGAAGAAAARATWLTVMA